MNALVTGGAGYIGSHTLLALRAAGVEPVVVDNLCNSSAESVRRASGISNGEIKLFTCDARSKEHLIHIIANHNVSVVIHFAALKAVGESVANPLLYYDNNVQGTIRLLEAMEECGVENLIFSSSATVYGNSASVPIPESASIQPTNPYGHTKAMCERIIMDTANIRKTMKVAILRYFNPVGAHESGRIGEDPNGTPNNLMPYVSQVAVGKLEQLTIHGTDYPTPDGTGVRDYIHVMDLAEGHVAALNALEKAKPGTVLTVNLGTSRGHSVLEVIHAFEAASGRKIPYTIGPRRPGDIAACYADASYAEKVLGWRAKRSLDQMCADAWNWQRQNPNGYRG